jgi:hypothetical protein
MCDAPTKTDPPASAAHPHRPVSAVDRARAGGHTYPDGDGNTYGNINAGRRDRSIWL